MTDTVAPNDRDVLLVVDVQKDFCPGGGLAVPRGHVCSLPNYGRRCRRPGPRLGAKRRHSPSRDIGFSANGNAANSGTQRSSRLDC